MNLLNIKTEVSRIPLAAELAVIKMGIIISRKTTSVGFNFRLLNSFKNFETLTDRQIVDIHDQVEKDDESIIKLEALHEFYKSLMQLRNLKNKNPFGFAQLAKFEQHMKLVRQELYHDLMKMNVASNIDVLLVFLEDGIITFNKLKCSIRNFFNILCKHIFSINQDNHAFLFRSFF